MRFLFLALTAISLALPPLFAGTKIVHRCVLTGQPRPQLRKILVIAVLENALIRQELEDEMEKLLAKSGVQGLSSHMVLPPRNELLAEELKQRIKAADYDAVLVIGPKAFRKETQEVGTKSVYIPPPFHQNLWPYWDMAFKQFCAKGFLSVVP